MSNVALLYATAPDAETAQSIATALVEARLAACVNVLGPIRSVFRWEGRIESAAECAFLVKTTADLAAPARQLILSLHPYAVPAILGIDVTAALSHAPFLDWIDLETTKTT